jgi:hypothetical protein
MSTTLTIEAFRGMGDRLWAVEWRWRHQSHERATGGARGVEPDERRDEAKRLGGGGLRKENDGREVVRFP